jgi:hypothetical protein
MDAIEFIIAVLLKFESSKKFRSVVGQAVTEDSKNCAFIFCLTMKTNAPRAFKMSAYISFSDTGFLSTRI